MKYLLIVLAFIVAIGLTGMKIENSSGNTNLIFHPKLPDGVYLLETKNQEVWYDSIQVAEDRLNVFRNPKYGYGVIFMFTYSYKRVNKESLVLNAISMKPEGVYVYPEQYDWHNDTLQIRYFDNGITKLIGPRKEEYTLNTTKPKLH